MKSISWAICSLSFLFTLTSFGQKSSSISELTIYFNDLSTNEGEVLILVQDESEKDISKLIVNINNKSAQVTIYLPNGKYGIIAFHDINGNEKLDTNVLGVPTEPYGFSNDARGLLSKPDYEETLVELNSNLRVTFELK